MVSFQCSGLSFVAWSSVLNAALGWTCNVCNTENRTQRSRWRETVMLWRCTDRCGLPGLEHLVSQVPCLPSVGQGRKHQRGGDQEIELALFLQDSRAVETLRNQMEPLKSHRNIALECGQSGGLPWKTWEGDLTVKPWTCVCSRCPGQRLQEFCAVNQMRERETPFFIYLVLT